MEEDLLEFMTRAVAMYRGAAGRLLPGLLAADGALDDALAAGVVRTLLRGVAEPAHRDNGVRS